MTPQQFESALVACLLQHTERVQPTARMQINGGQFASSSPLHLLSLTTQRSEGNKLYELTITPSSHDKLEIHCVSRTEGEVAQYTAYLGQAGFFQMLAAQLALDAFEHLAPAL